MLQKIWIPIDFCKINKINYFCNFCNFVNNQNKLGYLALNIAGNCLKSKKVGGQAAVCCSYGGSGKVLSSHS